MTTPCATCARPLDPADERCPGCDAPVPSAGDETVAVVAVDATHVEDAPPWSIPIREPAVAARAALQPRRRPGPRLAIVAAIVVVLALVVGSRLLGDDQDADTASVVTPDDEPVRADESGGMGPGFAPRPTTTTTTTTPAPTPETTGAPTTVVIPTIPVAPTSVGAPVAATPAPRMVASQARTGPNGTGSVPALSTSFRGWLAQLTSVPYDAGTDGLADEWQRIRGAVPGAVAARSDDWSAFRDGFWVLVDPGPFGSPDEVRAFCSSAGFDGEGACLPRELRG